MKNAILVLVLVACGGPPKANPCATKGATYVQRFVERANGTCGPIPDTIVNITADGEVAGARLDCESMTQDGCTARNAGCKTTTDGITCTGTSSVTFAADGSTSSGLITTNCSGNGLACVSTYDVSAVRQ
jgi:hypothetical protein